MQNIQIPKIPVQETFYLRQLLVNVFCIHNNKSNKAHIVVYHQGTVGKGPDVVCSLLFNYLIEVEQQYTKLYFSQIIAEAKIRIIHYQGCS